MSTYDALRFFGLDYYATASDIKAAYRLRATALRAAPAISNAKLVREAEKRMQMLNQAYAALHHRVDHTPPDVDPLPGVKRGAKPKVLTAVLRARWNKNLALEWWTQLVLMRAGRAAAVFLVMAAVGYGIVRGSAAKYSALSVVDAKTVSVPQVAPLPAARVAAVEKVPLAPEKKASVVTVESRPLRAPVLPGVDAEEAKAIGTACLAETGAKAGAFHACVVRTARETPHAIHLE